MNKEIGKEFRFLVVAFLSVGLTSVLSAGEPPPEKKNSISRFVKVIASAGKADADGKQELTVTLKIDPACYVYANPVGCEDLEGSQIMMAVKVGDRPLKAEIMYPPGVNANSKFLPNLKIYQGAVVIRATVRRSPGDVAPFEVILKIHGQRFDASAG